MPVQNEIRDTRGDVADEHPEKRRMSLLQRLASVGLGRREDEEEQEVDVRPAQLRSRQTGCRPGRPAPRPVDSRGSEPRIRIRPALWDAGARSAWSAIAYA